MVPNNIDQDFRKKLEERTIEPSAMAWDRLDAMLSVGEEKKQPNKRIWMYIAASFIAFMIIGAFLLQHETGGNGTKQVKSNDGVVIVETPLQRQDGQSDKEEQLEEIVNSEMTGPSQNTALAVETVARMKHKTVQEKPEAAPVVNDKKSNTINDNYKQEEVAAVKETNVSPGQESEQLLASSLNETSAKKKSSVKVNAGSLLSSVEGEIDQSFRSKTLQGVIKNFNTVKTSVANRNYQ